jgi:Icc-related predicted phosphoesterase
MGQKVSGVSFNDLVADDVYASGGSVRFVVMSDTHNTVRTADDARRVPCGDIFIHCGDMTVDGTAEEARAFNAWLGYLPHPVKVVIAGNHDLFAHPESFAANVAQCSKARRAAHTGGEAAVALLDNPSPAAFASWRHIVRTSILSNATHYLEGERAVVAVPGKGVVHLVGAPYTDVIAVSAMRAFALSEAAQGDALAVAWPVRAEAVDVLITHGPPRGVLDTFLGHHTGSHVLAAHIARRWWEVGDCPTAHVFGHVHKQFGAVRCAQLPTAAGQSVEVPTLFVNAASVVGLKHKIRETPYVRFDIPVNQLKHSVSSK